MSEHPTFANHDAGIFIGLTSSPFGSESQFCDYLGSMFKRYKEGIRANYERYHPGNGSISRIEFEKYFYDPRFYFVFGHFDIAVISLIDDFEMPVRTFAPYDPLFSQGIKTDFSEHFTSQVVVGPMPRFKRHLLGAAEDTFLRKKNRFPLIGVCQMKLNSGFVVGLGLDYLNSVIGYIKKCFEAKYPASNTTIRYLVLGSYSWNELTLLVFSDSYRRIGDFIVEIRESNYQNLITYLEHQKPDGSEFTDENNSLIGRLARLKGQDQRQSHIFETTLTTSGFDMNILTTILRGGSIENVEDVLCISPDDRIVGETRYFTKAGHVENAFREFHEQVDGEKYLLYAGKGNLQYPVYGGEVCTERFIDDFIKVRKHANEKHVLASITSIGIEKKGLPSAGDQHYYIHSTLRELTISVEELRTINSTLVKFGFPKILSFRILNLFAGYNQGISDRMLYHSFIELRPFVKVLQDLLRDVKFLEERNEKSELGELCSGLEDVINAFEKAYHNRLYLSEMLSEVTDFNLDFKGGIQQLVSAFDAAYKVYSSIFENEQVFCCVGGYPDIFSTESLIGLNYLHIFQPELFACIGAREASIAFLSFDPEFLELEREFSSSLARIKTASNNYEVSATDELKEYVKNTRILYEILNSFRYFRSITADILSYHLTFMGNHELFIFWYVRYFFMLHSSFQRLNRINENQFICLLVRILSVVHICKPQVYSTLDTCVGENSDSELYKVILGLEKEWLPIIRATVPKLWSINPFQEYSRKLMVMIDPYLETNRAGIDEELIGKVETSLHDAGEPYTFTSFSEDAGSTEKRDNIGNPREFLPYLQNLFYAYLQMMMMEAKEKGLTTLLKRDDQDGKPRFTSEEARILFDQRGGIFVCEPETRRNCFKWRTALLASLWDTSMRMKLNYIWRELPSSITGLRKERA